jgi:UDP-N-acetylmuramoyl-L-alanyl-D-glutamate--2,6-diaminopimelate ligase
MRPFIALSADKTAIINIDDKNGLYYCDVTIAKTLTYGLQESADFSARNIKQSIEFTEFDLYYKGIFSCKTVIPYFGIYNVYNMLAAIAYFVSKGYSPKRITILLKDLPPIAGRFDTFKTDSGIYVVVDYAHTPDAIENVLKSLSTVAKGDIISVLGAGGDRDRSKRAPMGKNAMAYSKHVILTSDNPRSEEPHSIIYDMLKGSVKQNYSLCIDREMAIKKALKMAKPNDIVIILGKGHEKTQTIKGKTTAFCDKTVAQYIIQKNEL